jgi:hypothetical protein
MAVVVLAARSFLAGSPPLVELGVTVTLGALAYAAALWMMRRRLVEDARAFGRADRSEVQAPGVAAAA